MAQSPIRIAVTGGAGQIAYSLLFRLAAGELFPNQKIALHILELAETMPVLQGVKMELEDCAFPLLSEVRIGSDPLEVFEGVNIAFLVGAKPRGPGMERKDLLSENGHIFAKQGMALSAVAAADIQVLVVGNPCNTNCLIAAHNAPRIAPERFHAMTRLDQNRAIALLANKARYPVLSISKMAIWGNHSSTQVPDYFNACIDGRPAWKVIDDQQWLEQEFMKQVQQRGAEIIKVRGKSSAASAASAAIDAVRALYVPTQSGDWFSSGIYSKGNPYGIDEGLFFSFPCTLAGIVSGVAWNSTLESKIKASEKELQEERDLVRQYLR